DVLDDPKRNLALPPRRRHGNPLHGRDQLSARQFARCPNNLVARSHIATPLRDPHTRLISTPAQPSHGNRHSNQQRNHAIPPCANRDNSASSSADAPQRSKRTAPIYPIDPFPQIFSEDWSSVPK